LQKIVTFLWFDNQAEEAMNHYISIFPDSKVLEASPGPDGKVMVVKFQLAGQEYMGLNGGPHFKFTEAISLFVNCEDQAEVDRIWDRLLEGGGQPSQCGWLKDRYGLSWQVIPKALGEMLGDSDREKAGRAMQAMMKMVKIDVAEMRRAFEAR
jgi:predicted 3-demethylubiquinone-9 3-methyltransferase (glyoxalase superfamily)